MPPASIPTSGGSVSTRPARCAGPGSRRPPVASAASQREGGRMHAESLWGLLGHLVDQRDQIVVDEDGELARLSELDEVVAAKHVKRFINVWAKRERRLGREEA